MKSDVILSKISEKLKESNPEKRTLVNIFLWNFEDDNGQPIKSIVMDLKELKIYDGSVTDPDVEITIKDEDFYRVGIKEIPFKDLLDSGKVKIKGDSEIFNKMIEKFNLNSKK